MSSITNSNDSSENNSHRKNTKRVGELAEAAFVVRATGLGFIVAKPWGDSERYDFVIDNGSRFWRIQVKATDALRAGAYETRATYTCGKGRAVYTAADTDFIACYIIPLDTWYIVPVEVSQPRPMLRFYPHRQAKVMRLEPYREAWHLLTEGSHDSDRHEPSRHDNRISSRHTVICCPLHHNCTITGLNQCCRL